jgi:hypothetical protein
MSCLSDEERFADLKIIRAGSGDQLFDLLQPYLDQGWQLTIFDQACAIIVKERNINESPYRENL